VYPVPATEDDVLQRRQSHQRSKQTRLKNHEGTPQESSRSISFVPLRTPVKTLSDWACHIYIHINHNAAGWLLGNVVCTE